MKIRKVVLNPSSNQYLRYAEKKLRELNDRRKYYNQSFSKAVLEIESTRIHLFCSDYQLSMILTGGDLPLILLSGVGGLQAYNYYTDRLEKTGIPYVDGLLSPIYNGRSQVSEKLAAIYRDQWTSKVLGEEEYLFLGGVNAYEMGIFSVGNNVYGRVEDSIGNIALVPDTFLPEFSGPYGSLFSLPAYKKTSQWNLFSGVIQYTINPANQSLQDSWYWTPSFFTAQPSDPYGFQPGFYYGVYPNQVYGPDFTDLESAKVSFKGLLDTRYVGGDYSYGWCEMVREVNSADVNDLCFYLQKDVLPVFGNPTFGYIRIAGTSADQFITTGSDLKGFSRSFVIPVDGEFVEPDVSMWNFEVWRDPSSSAQDSGVCVVVSEAAKADFYKWTGGLLTVYKTTSYHSHSTSRDGTILAIFESDDSVLISRVRVFDLAGERLPKDGAKYTAGGVTELRASDSVVSVEALTACVIPYREKDFELLSPSYDLSSALPMPAPSDNTDYLSSLSIVSFPKRIDSPPVLKKLVCDNGVDAEYGVSVDECFDSTMVVEQPYSASIEKLVGSWDGGIEGGTLHGKLRGSFVGSHPEMKFSGEGNAGDIFYELTRPDEFQMTIDTDGFVLFGPHMGDILPGSCVIENAGGTYSIDPECKKGCDGKIIYSAATTCGQSATFEDSDPVDPPTITGPEDAYIGSQYIGSGGVTPYIYSMSPGTIDSTTGIILDVSGLCGPGTVTVTDDCGKSATMDIRIHPGTWVRVGTITRFLDTHKVGPCPPPYNPATECYACTEQGGECLSDGSSGLYRVVAYVAANNAPDCYYYTYTGNTLGIDPLNISDLEPYGGGCNFTVPGRTTMMTGVQIYEWQCP